MRVKRGCKIREVAGERILVVQGVKDVDLTKVVVFNESSEWLWNNLADKNFTEDDVVDLLLARYSANEQQVRSDAKRWVSSLADANLLE